MSALSPPCKRSTMMDERENVPFLVYRKNTYIDNIIILLSFSDFHDGQTIALCI